MSNYTDWLGGLDLIPNKQDKTILELGLGYGTLNLLESFKQVYSFELYKDDDWFNQCDKMFTSYTNWTRKFLNFSDIGMDVADQNLLDSKGIIRDQNVFQAFINELIKFVELPKIDIIFVDQGFHMRGESVNYFLDYGVPTVMAHDFKVNDNNLYGWNLINNSYHPQYTVQLYDSPLGLNIWTKQ